MKQPPVKLSDERCKRFAVSGFTLVEILVTISVCALLLTLAAPSFSSLIAAYRARNAATDLYVALALARSEAVKQDANVTLSPPPGGNWQTGWQVLSADGTVLDAHGAVNGVSIATGSASVVYQSSGRPQGNPPLSFLVSGSGNATQLCVLVATSGRPYVKRSAC